jgi:hypothetical protein
VERALPAEGVIAVRKHRSLLPRDVGKLFRAALDLHEIAWDVYLIYKPGIIWEGQQPPHPTFWIHQLDEADPSLLLCVNPARFSAEVEKLLGQHD